jgi:bacterioferritin
MAARKTFLTDVQTLRRRARQHIEQGAVTPGYKADRATVVRVLNEALATEIVCVLRYKRHYFMASGLPAQSVAQEFLQHANEEQVHADQIAQRIVQLGGEPNLSPEGMLTRSHSEYVEGSSLVEMIQEDLVAERVAIDSYREIINWLGPKDPTTRRMLEEILATEEEHAEDLVSLLTELGPGGAPAATAPGTSRAAPARPGAKPEGPAAKPPGAPAPPRGGARSRAAAGRGSVRRARRRGGARKGGGK